MSQTRPNSIPMRRRVCCVAGIRPYHPGSCNQCSLARGLKDEEASGRVSQSRRMPHAFNLASYCCAALDATKYFATVCTNGRPASGVTAFAAQNGLERDVRAVEGAGVILVLRERGAVQIDAGKESAAARPGQELRIQLPVRTRLRIAAHRAGRGSCIARRA